MSTNNSPVEVVMPQMGESVAEGTVLEWLKNPGDHVDADETIVEISTDKVDAEVPAPASGTLTKVHAQPGDTVTVGTLLAEIQTGDSPQATNGKVDLAPQTEDVQEIVITMPQMGESVAEGTVLEWLKNPGDHVDADETIVEISTDKVDAEVPAPASGTLTKVHAQPGDTVTVGSELATLQTGAQAQQPDHPKPQENPPATAGTPAPEGIKVSPVANRVAVANGVDLRSVTGSGANGKIMKQDVLDAQQSGAQTGTATKLRGGAAMLARYMDESRTVPTATSFRTITVTTLDGRRKQLKEAGVKVSFTHLIAFAIAKAATEQMPVMATHYEEREDGIYQIDDEAVNLGIAVDVEKKDGSRTLMVPVIRNAGGLSFQDFVTAFNELVEKSRTNKLTADDLSGGNVTLTNPGGIGTISSVPRLMAGQGTIVATGSISYPPGLSEVGALIGAEKVMTMTSTYDHRIIQGAQSGQFLKVVEQYLQGENNFYEDVFASVGAPVGAQPTRPTPQAIAQAAVTQTAASTSEPASHDLLQAVQAATALLKAYRTFGHLAARLDPLGSEPEGDPSLDPEPLGLTKELMERIPADILRMHVPGRTLAEALPHLQETYCGTIAYEIEHLASHQQREWLRQKIESGEFRQPLTKEEQGALLRRLVEVDALERFMHKAYLGQKQFSIEGLDMAVPMLDELIQQAAHHDTEEVVIGMAHRGRLNVLAHNLGRPYETIFAEFEGASTLEAVTTIPQGGTGDVKYHHGERGEYRLADESSIFVNLESNPSHLEYVHPVVLGSSRALQTTRDEQRLVFDRRAAMPIVVHGDAAFPAQGVVAESLNLQALDGYQVGGTIHIIQNNQVGFTTDPDDARSTQWASDLAKGFDVPIIHVNADDVEACVAAARLAFSYRKEFGHDVLIDLIGYRRFGHNEADEPAYTQPEMYAVIKAKKRVGAIWADKLVERGVVNADEVEQEKNEVWNHLTTVHQQLKAEIKAAEEAGEDSQVTGEYQLDRSPSPQTVTAVDGTTLQAINEELLQTPEGFTVHPKLVKQLERRRAALGSEGGIDWGQAEALAFASLIQEGVPVRLTGQDCERGTFSQRHLVLHDAQTGRVFAPIQQSPNATATFELHNSPLSEIACLGFEYGYSLKASETLVLWEAQFGDFVNSAQVIIDQFISPGLAKWGQTSRLTLLLPHGYEGSGPEHSSGRLERFLQLAAEGNMRIANLTTPAQYFHMLRRQALIEKQRPLVIMTPKSLLRLPQATNRIEHLADTQFYPVLGEPRVDEATIERLALCTGKIYYDLVGHAKRPEVDRLAVGRIELLYPFPEKEALELIERYPNLKEVVWVQEEPRNMGARAHMFPRLMQILPQQLAFGYIGRPERASSGEGYPAAHIEEQSRIIETVLDLDTPVSLYPAKTPGER